MAINNFKQKPKLQIEKKSSELQSPTNLQSFEQKFLSGSGFVEYK